MDNALKLRVMFDMVDKITKPMRQVLVGSKGVATALKETRRELSDLEKTQANVASFRKMRDGLDRTGGKLADARERIKELASAVRATDAPTEKMVADLNAAREAGRKLGQQQRQQTNIVNELRNKLTATGIDTRNLSQHERDLRGSIAATTATMKQQEQQLERISARERRVNAARAARDKVQGTAANMAVAGYTARSAGTHVLGDLRETLGDAKDAETEGMRIRALGLGDHASNDAIKYVRGLKTYGVSSNDNLTMMRDALTIFADEHHAQMVMPTLAKMKFANDAMFGAEDAHANEEKFMNMLKVIELRGGTKDEATFKREANMVQKVLTATGGRVGGDEWRNFIQTGGVAAKQMRQDAFYYQMEPLIQEMGGHAVGTGLMSAYSNLYQGKTTVRAARQMMNLGLLDRKSVEYNKIGMIKQIRPGALAGGDLFKASPLEWVEKVLLPKMKAKGITDPDKVKDMISTIITNRTAANLFTTMYMQSQQIHKNEKLNKGADGIDEAHAKALQLASGRELEALAQVKNLRTEIGEKILPTYSAALDIAANATKRLVAFMKEHGTVAKVVLIALAAIAGLAVAFGTLMIAIATMLGPLAVVRFSMLVLGMQGGILSTVLGGLGAALRMVGTAIMFVGRALLMNPIGLAITGIALAAFLIYEYWTPIKAFFGTLWAGVKTIFGDAMTWFSGLPSRFAEFGSNLIGGLVNGITNGLGAVKTAIMNVADSTVAWFKEKLGIHSPSRVFGELGGFIGQGAAIGIEGEGGRVARAAVGLATVAAASFAGPAGASPIGLPPIAFDTRPPLAAQPSVLPSASMAPAPVTINIYAQAGQDAQDIARAVAAELDRRERASRARTASSLSDH
ncbi:phage tail tape measure protein [Burkholderia glumae]